MISSLVPPLPPWDNGGRRERGTLVLRMQETVLQTVIARPPPVLANPDL